MRRVVAIIVALFLLLILFDRFVLIELLVRRIGIPLLFAIAGALACIGTGFVVRRGARDLALNLLLGIPFFGTLCFLLGIINISRWTMVPLVGVLGGIGVASLWPFRTGEGACPPLKPPARAASATC
jgi:Na+/melibiose symporter-like transporter